jgi:Na+/melibiose symporter-like transporter
VFWGAWGVLLPAIKTITGATDAMLGKALLGTAIGAVPTMFGAGMLIKKFSKWSLFTGLIFFSMSIAALTIVNSPLTLAIVLLFVGASSGALDVIMNSGVAVLESTTGKRYFNYAHAAFPIAVIITSPIVGLARQFEINIVIILLTMSAIIAATAFASLRLKVDSTLYDNEDNKKTITKTKGKSILFTKAILIMGFLGMLIHIMENSVEQWGAIYLEENLFATPSIASLGLTGYMLMLFVGRILAQKIGQGWSERKILTIATITAVIGFATVAVSPNKAFVILGFSIAGLGIAPIVPMIFSLIGINTAPDMKIKAISTVTVIAYAGYLLCPPLIGYIAGLYNLKTAWIFICFIGIASVLIISILSSVFRTKEYNSKNIPLSNTMD